MKPKKKNIYIYIYILFYFYFYYYYFIFYLRSISGKGCCVLGSFEGNASFPMWFKHLVAAIIKVGEPIEKKGGAHVHATNA